MVNTALSFKLIALKLITILILSEAPLKFCEYFITTNNSKTAQIRGTLKTSLETDKWRKKLG